jgi:hypothetical protein
MLRRCTTLSCLVVVLILSMVSIPSFSQGPRDTRQMLDSGDKESRASFEQYVQSLYEVIELKKRGLDFDLFRYALIGYFNLKSENALNREGIISIIDFRKPSNDRRFYVIDLARQKVLYHTFVAHGLHSGNMYARHFSNKPGSLQSSLGFFVTGDSYDGEYGYSLYLYGMDKGFNDKAKSRGIVVHGAYYVGSSAIKQHGKIGSSQGCPALPPGPHVAIIDTIKGGTCLFQFYDDKNYLAESPLLDLTGAVAQFKEEYSPFIQIKVSDR